MRRIVVALLLGLAFVGLAQAQQEFPPAQGKGRVVMVVSGHDGMLHYAAVSARIAGLGYDAVLFDANALANTDGRAVAAALDQAAAMPHALPGKAAVVGFSLGGGITLAYAARWPDRVVGVVEWYPATNRVGEVSAFVDRLQVPVLMLAGEADFFRRCCLVGTARRLAAAAKAAGKPFELVVYPKAGHDFVYGARGYDPETYQDAFRRTAAALKEDFAR